MMEMCSKIPILVPMNDAAEHIYVKLGAFTKLESINHIFNERDAIARLFHFKVG